MRSLALMRGWPDGGSKKSDGGQAGAGVVGAPWLTRTANDSRIVPGAHRVVESQSGTSTGIGSAGQE